MLQIFSNKMNKLLFIFLSWLHLTASSLCGTNYEFKYYYIISDTSNLVTGPDVASQTNAIDCHISATWAATILGSSWIWDSKYVSQPTLQQTIVVTKYFNIPGIPATAFLDLAVDDYASVTINGKSDNCLHRIQIYSSTARCDVQQYLTPGNNVIVIQATNLGWPGSTYLTNTAGLIYKITVHVITASYGS